MSDQNTPKIKWLYGFKFDQNKTSSTTHTTSLCYSGIWKIDYKCTMYSTLSHTNVLSMFFQKLKSGLKNVFKFIPSFLLEYSDIRQFYSAHKHVDKIFFFLGRYSENCTWKVEVNTNVHLKSKAADLVEQLYVQKRQEF